MHVEPSRLPWGGLCRGYGATLSTLAETGDASSLADECTRVPAYSHLDSDLLPHGNNSGPPSLEAVAPSRCRAGTTWQATNSFAGVAEWLELPAALVGAFAIALLVAFVSWRSWSLHPILMQIWRILLGRLTMSNVELSELVQQRDDLVRFRFVFGIRARTVMQAERSGQWAKEHNEDLADIATCSTLFDLEKCDLIDSQLFPTELMQRIEVMLALTCLFGAALALVCVASDRALVELKVSHVYLTLSGNDARTLDGTEQFTVATCGSITSKKAGEITPAERTAVCNLLGTPIMRDDVRRMVHDQRWLFAPLLATLMCLAWYLRKAIRAGVTASSMHARREVARAAAKQQERVFAALQSKAEDAEEQNLDRSVPVTLLPETVGSDRHPRP